MRRLDQLRSFLGPPSERSGLSKWETALVALTTVSIIATAGHVLEYSRGTETAAPTIIWFIVSVLLFILAPRRRLLVVGILALLIALAIPGAILREPWLAYVAMGAAIAIGVTAKIWPDLWQQTVEPPSTGKPPK